MAEQVEPVQRKVALKIIKLGMDTREVTARFEAERQALALLVNCGRLLHVADSATGKEVLSPLTNTLATSAAEFSPDGKLVARAGSDTSYNRGEARIWNVATRGLVHAIVQSDGVPAIAFSPGGRWLDTGCEDRTARVWNVLTGEPATPSLLHSGTLISLAFSPDSQLLASL